MSTEKNMARIFIVDDHPIMRETLQVVLERQPNFLISGISATGTEALEQIANDTPDLALIDVSLTDMSGIEVAERLRARHPDLLLVMLSGHGERSYVEKALEAGANGYILKGNAEEIVSAIGQVIAGEQYLSSPLR